jgi:uncharacterized membrane protein
MDGWGILFPLLLIILFVLHFTTRSNLKIELEELRDELARLKDLLKPPATGTAKPPVDTRTPETKKVEDKVVPCPESPSIPTAEKPAARDVKKEMAPRELVTACEIASPLPGPEPGPRQSSIGATAPEKRENAWAQKWVAFKANVDWEIFAGAKLFAWLGVLALFIGAGFFVKYSIDRNLLPPAMRLAISALAGLGLILASSRFDRVRYHGLRHTLGACGIGVLYSVVFAATLYYEYLPKHLGFGLLTVVSAAAFVLAIYHRGIAISVLGAMGAYLTPIMVRTGQGNLFMLFLYLAVINIGLYWVTKKLKSPFLLLVATTGTLGILTLATFAGSLVATSMLISGVWIANLALFSIFLAFMSESPQENQSLSWSGHLLYGAAAITVLGLLGRSGDAPFYLVTAAMAGAVILALRNRGWFPRVIPYGAVSFLLAFLWAVMCFEPQVLSWGFVILLLYGVVGGLGPVVLIRKYGLENVHLRWFQVFPVALGLMLLTVVLMNPEVSIWFWLLLLTIELLCILICLVFGALVQVGMLTLFFIISGLAWILRIPAGGIGLEFFSFLLVAGALFSAVIFYVLRKLPSWKNSFNTSGMLKLSCDFSKAAMDWVTAFPVLGAFVLLGVTFRVQHPLNPHPAMVTLVCLMGLSLFLTKRLFSPSLGVVALVAAFLAQGVWALQPGMQENLFLASAVWSGILFCLALFTPFVFFKRLESWSKIWMAWALFEVTQGFYLIYAADHLWPRDFSGWAPLALAFLKLPFLEKLMSRLRDRPQRNSLLAFHGGVLLFYISSVPVMLLDKGWLGLTLVIEAFCLLWLNRRVVHEGLRWVASLMAPTGMVLLYLALPQMKGPEGLTVMNGAVLAVAACVLFLFLSVKQSGFPQRKLGQTDLPEYFKWLALGSGFFLANLLVADIFSGAGGPFKVWPQGNAGQGSAYALIWLTFGAVLWSTRALNMAKRATGLVLMSLGAASMILLPFLFPEFVPDLQPVFNLGLAVYGIAMAIMSILFWREPASETSRGMKNFFLALLLVTGFMAVKVVMNSYFQPGASLRLFFGHTAPMAVASAFGWIAYGLGLLLWPRGLDKPFRKAGVILITLGLAKTMLFPFAHKQAFGALTPILNTPSLLFAFTLLMLIGLTLDRPKQQWPWEQIDLRAFWGILLAGMTFFTLNVEIAAFFGIRGRAFSLWTYGRLAQQLAYSLGWMIFAIGLLLVGIRWQRIKVRWAALILLVITAFKISFMDLWRLGGLYRVASFVGFAVVAILVSFLYQRYLVKGGRDAES